MASVGVDPHREPKRGDCLVITVRDHGCGVPESERERIFEPFFTTRTRGTGLGLAVARRIVELHGGTISVTDPPDGGALFRVTVPSSGRADRPGRSVAEAPSGTRSRTPPAGADTPPARAEG